MRLQDIAIIGPAVALLGIFVYWCYKDILEERPQYHADWLDVDASGRAYDPITHEQVAQLDTNDDSIVWSNHRF